MAGESSSLSIPAATFALGVARSWAHPAISAEIGAPPPDSA